MEISGDANGGLSGEITAFGESGDAVGCAKGERFDRHGGLAATGRDEAAAVAQEKIFYVVGAVVGVNDGGFWIVAHAAGAEEMHGKLLFLDGRRPYFFRTC